MIFTKNELKKWTLKSQKSQIAILLLNQCSISAVFPIVRFAGDQKTALSGEPLYFHTPVTSKLIFVFVLNLMEVEFTDRQLLKYLKQARTSTGGQEWRNNKNILKLQEPKHLNQIMDWRCLWNLKKFNTKTNLTSERSELWKYKLLVSKA